jgi:hypothetical protein
MLTKRDIGRWVRIRFWDHSLNRKTKKNTPLLCEASGMIRSVTQSKIVICHFFIDDEDSELVGDNIETLEIVRSCIIEYGWAEILKWNND